MGCRCSKSIGHTCTHIALVLCFRIGKQNPQKWCFFFLQLDETERAQRHFWMNQICLHFSGTTGILKLMWWDYIARSKWHWGIQRQLEDVFHVLFASTGISCLCACGCYRLVANGLWPCSLYQRLFSSLSRAHICTHTSHICWELAQQNNIHYSLWIADFFCWLIWVKYQ